MSKKQTSFTVVNGECSYCPRSLSECEKYIHSICCSACAEKVFNLFVNDLYERRECVVCGKYFFRKKSTHSELCLACLQNKLEEE